MADLLGATNPVPGYEKPIVNRNTPLAPESPVIKNVTDPGRVGRPDARTEQQDSTLQGDEGRIRYDSNFQTFLQRLKGAPELASALSKLFMGRDGTVVISGMSEGIATEMSKVLAMLHMDQDQLLKFLTGQFKAGSRLGGALFALMRSAYAQSSSDNVREDILQFLRSYLDNASTGHIEGNLLRGLRGMADAMPSSWGGKLQELAARLENGIAAGDRRGNLALLQRELFPHMADYVEQTHDTGRARGLLSLLALDLTRYENGAEENLLRNFHQLNGYGTLKEQLGGIDDRSLLALLRSGEGIKDPQVARFYNHLTGAAARALRGEGSVEVQQIFQQLVAAMLINESVYMPINHYLLPLEWNGRMLFSELWVDPDAGDEKERGGGRQTGGMTFLLKMDVQSLGLFDVVLTSRGQEVAIKIACPEQVSPFAVQIEESIARILTGNGLTPVDVSVRRMERPVTLTEVFPRIFEGKNNVNVKV